MAEVIRMPLLSDTMKEGVIAAWHKKVGDKVKSDDVLADVETDKATMEVMPYVDGTLLYLGVEKGKAAKVNDIIAIVGKEGEDISSYLSADNAVAASTPQDDNKATVTKESDSAEAPPAPAASVSLPKDATVVRMPLLSDTMKEGKIVAWHKNLGDAVKSDDILADVETDKATMEVMAYADGVLLYRGVEEGSAAKVNDIIAIVGKAGTDVNAYVAAEKSGAQHTEATPAASAPADTSTTTPTTSAAPSTVAETSAASDERVKASPLAKKLAKEKGFDLHQIKGSGDNGRIVKRDVEEFKPSAASSAAAAIKSVAVTGEDTFTDTTVSQMRAVIARRLGESKFSAPHFYLRISVNMDNAMESRKHINQLSPVKVSFNDMIIKACAMALRQHPQVNSSWLGDVVRTYDYVNIGSAVAVDEGLLVPVIRNADLKGLAQIATDANELIDKARNKKLQPAEMSGNTFTISNLGMMDIDDFTAIINPPDAAILAVGKIAPTPVVENGAVVVRQIMRLTMSCDHRVVDGAVGARFLQTLKTYLENPVTMLV